MKTTQKSFFELKAVSQARNLMAKLATCLAATVLVTSCSRSGGSESGSSSRSQTMAWLNGSLAVINQNGTVSIVPLSPEYDRGNSTARQRALPSRFKPGTAQQITNIANAVSFSGDSPLVMSADGNWWQLKNGYREADPTPIKPENHIIEVAEGYQSPVGAGVMAWVRQPNGTVFLSQGGYNVGLKPGPKLDKVKRLYARMQKSMHLTMLRADGTVWIDTNFFAGPITASGEACANRVAGLDDVEDFSEFTPFGYSDTGVALKKDGSIVYWGIPFVIEQYGIGLPAPEKPALKQLSFSGKAAKVVAGPSCGVVIDQEGHVWVWGQFPDVDGKTFWPVLRGKNMPAESAASEKVFQVEGLNNIVDVELTGMGSDIQAFALAKDGGVWVWTTTIPPQKIYDGAKVP